jgi:hypothetical protein
MCMLALAFTLSFFVVPVTASADTQEQYFSIKQKKGKFGIISNNSQDLILPCEYDSIYYFFTQDRNALDYIAVKGDKVGIVQCILRNRYEIGSKDKAKWIIPCEYDQMSFMKPYYFVVKKDSLVGAYDVLGNVAAPCEYSEIDYDSTYNIFTVKKNGLYGITRSGSVLFPCKYSKEDIYNFMPFPDKNSKLFITYSNGKSGLSYGESEEVVLPCAYDSFAYVGTNYLVLAINGDQSGVYSLYTNKWFMPMATQKITFYRQDGNLIFDVTDASGHTVCYNTEGKQVYNFPQWPKRRSVTKNDIPNYDNIAQTVNNLPRMYYAAHSSSSPTYTHLINDKGIVLLDLRTTKPVTLSGRILCAKRNGRMGIVDSKTGKQLSPYAFDGYLTTHIVNGVFRDCMYNNTTTGRTLFVYENGRFIAKKTFARSETRSEKLFLQDYLDW